MEPLFEISVEAQAARGPGLSDLARLAARLTTIGT